MDKLMVADDNKTSAGGVTGSIVSNRGEGRGSNPTPALHSIMLKPISFAIAKRILVKYHYLHSLPGGTKLAFGIFLDDAMLGAITFGAGPALAYSLVRDATQDDYLALTRLWLSDRLPKNSESRVIAIALRFLKKYTNIKFLVSYADPTAGHIGTIYQATGWTYTGLSQATPLIDIGDGKARHSRSLAHAFGSHSLKYLTSHEINIKLIEQTGKHRYIYFLDPSWRHRLNVPASDYPKKEDIRQQNLKGKETGVGRGVG